MAFDLDTPTVFRVGEPTLGLPVMSLDYRPGATPDGDPPAARLARLEARVRLLENNLLALRQAILDIEFPPPPPPWYRRLLAWLQQQWQDWTS